MYLASPFPFAFSLRRAPRGPAPTGESPRMTTHCDFDQDRRPLLRGRGRRDATARPVDRSNGGRAPVGGVPLALSLRGKHAATFYVVTSPSPPKPAGLYRRRPRPDYKLSRSGRLRRVHPGLPALFEPTYGVDLVYTRHARQDRGADTGRSWPLAGGDPRRNQPAPEPRGASVNRSAPSQAWGAEEPARPHSQSRCTNDSHAAKGPIRKR